MRYLVGLLLLALLVLQVFLTMRTAQKEFLKMATSGADAGAALESGGVAARPGNPGSSSALAHVGAQGPRRASEAGGAVEPVLRTALEYEPPAVAFTLTGFVHDELGTPLYFFGASAGGTGRQGVHLDPHKILPDGTFALPGLPAGRSELRVWAPGHEAVSLPVELPFEGLLEVTLTRRARISGVVVDSAGEPAEGVRLAVEGEPDRPATTGLEGRFDLEAPVGEVRLGFSDDEHLATEIVLELAPGEHVRDLVVRLKAGGVIEGIVRPLSGVSRPREVSLGNSDSTGRKRIRRLVTDGNGRFRASGLSTGAFTVRVRATQEEIKTILGSFESGQSGLLRREALVAVVEGETSYLEIERQSYSLTRLRVRVTVDGAPVERGKLQAFGPGDAEVRAELGSESPGSFSFVAVPGDWRFDATLIAGGEPLRIRWREEVPAGSEHGTELRLETGSISGSVRLDGEPSAPGLRILATGVGEAREFERSVQVDSEGRYRIDTLPAGRYTLRARARTDFGFTRERDLLANTLEGVQVEAGMVTRHGDITPRTGGVVSLRSSVPGVAQATIVLRGGDGTAALPTRYEHGRFTSGVLEPGIYSVEVASGPLVLEAPLSIEIVAGSWEQPILRLVAR